MFEYQILAYVSKLKFNLHWVYFCKDENITNWVLFYLLTTCLFPLIGIFCFFMSKFLMICFKKYVPNHWLHEILWMQKENVASLGIIVEVGHFFIFLSTAEKGLDKKQEKFVTVFFLMHQWFMTSEELAQAFIDLYPFNMRRYLIFGSVYFNVFTSIEETSRTIHDYYDPAFFKRTKLSSQIWSVSFT